MLDWCLLGIKNHLTLSFLNIIKLNRSLQLENLEYLTRAQNSILSSFLFYFFFTTVKTCQTLKIRSLKMICRFWYIKKTKKKGEYRLQVLSKSSETKELNIPYGMLIHRTSQIVTNMYKSCDFSRFKNDGFAQLQGWQPDFICRYHTNFLARWTFLSIRTSSYKRAARIIFLEQGTFRSGKRNQTMVMPVPKPDLSLESGTFCYGTFPGVAFHTKLLINSW